MSKPRPSKPRGPSASLPSPADGASTPNTAPEAGATRDAAASGAENGAIVSGVTSTNETPARQESAAQGGNAPSAPRRSISPADRAALLGALFAPRTPPAGPRHGKSALATLALFGLLWLGAALLPEPDPAPPPPPPKKEYLVDLNPPPPKPAPPAPPALPPPPAETPAPVQPSPAPRAPVPANAVPSVTPPAPAQAGQIIAAEPDPSAPVNLTDNTFITGDSAQYAGGTTASNGTNDKAVYSPIVDPSAKPGGQVLATPPPPKKSKLDRSRPVGLDEDNWGCAWPREADAEQIDEQAVVLRVRVNPRGQAELVTLESDPGNGFGAAAVACAKKTRFTPALDADGRPVSALSPPIRVRFTR